MWVPLLLLLLAVGAPADAKKKEEAVIEEVGAKQLEQLVEQHDYVAVFWYGRRCKIDCDAVLTELETIDDDTDKFGVQFVKINDKKLAKKYGISEFPALTYFRNKEPIKYEGDLMNEDEVLEFLTSLDAMELPDQIEEVNAKILDKIVEEQPYVAVFFCPSVESCRLSEYKSSCRKCERALKELENIDDEADQLGIAFVKINDEALADEYSLDSLPTLVYYRNRIPIVYDGDLTKEEDVLDWLVQNKSTGDDDDEIEDVSETMLEAMIDSVDYLAVLFYQEDDEDSEAALAELENIDDECDDRGIHFVKTDDEDAARSYGIEEFPTLVYFEKEIPNIYDGDLTDEDEVLAWLIHQLESDEIEDVTDEMLDKLIKEESHVAVLFYDENDKKSQRVLVELENIDDECDKNRIVFVKIDNDDEAKEYGIEETPTLVYFEDGVPSVYDGDLMKEEEVLAWLLDQVENEMIEDVTDEMLDKLIDGTGHLAALFSEHDDVTVLFYDKGQKKSQKVLVELENIDDECDEHGIVFVKIDNTEEAIEYGIEQLPTLVYFENEIPSIYDGDLMNEEEVLAWLVRQVSSDEIEDVTDEMLDKIIERNPYVAAVFWDDKDDKQDLNTLVELENIDDECDKHGIVFVKIDNDEEAKEYGIEELPTLVYFENQIPSIYEGDLNDENQVLEWLVEQKESSTIEEVTDEILDDLVKDHGYVAVYYIGGPCKKGDQCSRLLDELENIDDETDEHGIIFVTTEDTGFAKSSAGIKKFPALVLYKNGHPLAYPGKIADEEAVLKWLTDDKTLELPDQIEEVNGRMLKKFIDDDSDDVVAFFYKKKDKNADAILAELEHIDDDTERAGITFVKCSDSLAAKQYQVTRPAIVFFHNDKPVFYKGDLKDEDKLLEWLMEMKDTVADDVIEEVKGAQLQKMVDELDYLVVFFYDDKCKNCDAILAELENIDDEADDAGIHFVKTMDTAFAKSLGIHTFPTVVYFEDSVPIVYNGDLKKEEAVLQWVLTQKSDSDTTATAPFSKEQCFSMKVDGGNAYQCCPPPDRRQGELTDENSVLDWAIKVKDDDSIEEIDRPTLLSLIDSEDYLAVYFYVDNSESSSVLKYMEMIDDEAAEYGIRFVKINDKLMAKKYGFRDPPGLAYFRKGKHIKFDGDLYDEEEILDWLTNPDNMELTDAIEKINRKMFARLVERTDHYFAVFFYTEKNCKQCEKVLQELEHIDDEAGAAGIDFVKIDDMELARQYGVFALPAVVLFRGDEADPVIYAGDLKNEERILEWLLVEKNPGSEVIEELSGQELQKQIDISDAIAVYFWNASVCDGCDMQQLDKYLAALYKSPAPAKLGRKAAPAAGPDDDQDDDDDEETPDCEPVDDDGEPAEAAAEEADDNDSCADCAIILQELENIDDDTDRHGIKFVKTQDMEMANSFGVTEFPALIYFEKQTPSVFEGDLRAEEDVLQWLVLQKTEDRIETVNRGVLEQMLEDTQYLAVFFYKPNCKACDVALSELETIDDECDLYGIHMVKIQDPQLAKRYGIKTLPALVYFRNGNPLIYEGDLRSADQLMEWLFDEDSRELFGEIETVNRAMLERLMEVSPFLCALFYDEECSDCGAILEELENIDDEADMYGIDFVKISDEEAAQKYHILHTPALVYFRKRIPIIYEGDMTDDEKVLSWLTSQDVLEIKDEIEEVNRKMLDKLLDENDFVAVYFYENDCPRCDEVLTELETIDDEADNLDITFVKIRDTRYAKKYGISKLPAMVYFRRRFPSIYRGDLLNETEVLDWLQKNRYKHPELNLFMYAIGAVSVAFVGYTTFLVFCFHGNQQKAA
ncbi:uncharacterized protein LOC122391084 isoform X5 [Amphibalanus amphitrite]|uniref:uncharacterized protein LOC122391084 isoform X5 n=1 Tax=Amphibalanus amphitrite TaxID=1232801 RepID=UPI001C90584D|nr:uncharacterized protein LOC122391084 isoform X5 [Amphibalanus amphitrite]